MTRATYSPEDNKLRLYPSERLSPEDYERFKRAGFKWAPKQKLFVAPMWTPARFDLLREFAGEVGDEDTSLIERQEERAERFEEYSDKRKADAIRARDHVRALSDNIPMGQPILIGHHSQRKAERDKEKIERGMKKAVSMWETSKYWTQRASCALAHVKYKELPGVRARRIKKLGAEMRVYMRDKEHAQKWLAFFNTEGLTHDQARGVVGRGDCRLVLPRKEGDKPDFDGKCSAYDALTGDYPTLYAPRTLQEVIDAANSAYPKSIARLNRWIEHYQNRIAYETAMLEEQGAAELIAKKPRPKQKPICNYPEQVTIKRYRETATYTPHAMTKAEYSELVKRQSTGTWESVDGTHRVKVALIRRESVPAYQWQYAPVFITDAPIKRPEAQALAIAAE